MPPVANLTVLTEQEFVNIKECFSSINGLSNALEWALAEPGAISVPTVVPQDEFTQDVVFRYGSLWVVFDST